MSYFTREQFRTIMIMFIILYLLMCFDEIIDTIVSTKVFNVNIYKAHSINLSNSLKSAKSKI